MKSQKLKKELIKDVLADRYATTPMVNLWAPRNKVYRERDFLVASLATQRDFGIRIPRKVITAYRKNIGNINLRAITARELQRRHDVKARVEIFNDLAKSQLSYKPFTARDLTDNIEQLQILLSMKILRDRTVSLLHRMSLRAQEWGLLDMMGRSHFVGGQTITLGKMFSDRAQELLLAFYELDHLIGSYRLRGIKGPMGTQQDLITLLGSKRKALAFENRMRKHLGFPKVLDSVGQVYPRSLDFAVVAKFAQLASAPANMAVTMRLMAGVGLLFEGFSKTQTGSTAMPHKVNARTCERIKGLLGVIKGFLNMTESLLGEQWYAGDVSCSVIRRVSLPGACFALDGLYEAAMTVLDEMGIFEGAIETELRQALPFMSTTSMLLAITAKGVGREDAHQMIKDHAVAAIKVGAPGSFTERLVDDVSFPLDRREIRAMIVKPNHGAAWQQVTKVCAEIKGITDVYPEAKTYVPEPIL